MNSTNELGSIIHGDFYQELPDEYKLFGFTIETSHSESKFMLSINDRDKLIKALQNFDEELIFTVD